MRKSHYPGISLFLTLCFPLLHATDAIWTGATSSDLNSAANWEGNILPTGIATFDSSYASVNHHPTASALFTIDSFNFVNHAHNFQYTFTGPGALNFTGAGITGSHTNPRIIMDNAISMTTGQFFFNPNTVSSSSIGSATLCLKNSSAGMISMNNAAQIVFADSDSFSTVPITADNHANIDVINHGSISGANEAAQIFLKGSSITAGDHFVLHAANKGCGSKISAHSNTGQIVFDAANTTATLTGGNYVDITLRNGNKKRGATIASIEHGNNAGQLVLDGKNGTASVSLGDYADITLISDRGSIISCPSSGNDAGQILLDGNKGNASFTLGNRATLTLSNQHGSKIPGLGYDAAQLVIDGDRGTSAFSVGHDAFLEFNNGKKCTIQSGKDGHDAAQLLIDANKGTASFAGGNNVWMHLVNSGTITSYHNAGQVVMDGNRGTASMTLGNNCALTVINEGSIYNSSRRTPVAQIAFNGSLANSGEFTLNTGNKVDITAINTSKGSIVNHGHAPIAQIYFKNTTINGNPTLTAINKHRKNGKIAGILFEGTSKAAHTNIALVNSSLLVKTRKLLEIGSLSGDPQSSVKLRHNLQINTASGVMTTFAGVISEAECGKSNLIIEGWGTQQLAGVNTYKGNTIINGGRLLLTGSVRNSVLMNGGILDGTGTVGGDLTVNASAAAIPGINISKLHVAGNYTQKAGGAYVVKLSDANGITESSMLAIGGSAFLDGAVAFYSQTDTYLIGRPYTILTASAISGTFNSLVYAIHPFLDVQALYNRESSVQLLFSTNFVRGAKSYNQTAAALQIDSIAVPRGDKAFVIDNLLDIDACFLPKALDLLAGEQYTCLVSLNQYANRRFTNRIFNAIRSALGPCFSGLPCGKTALWTTFEAGGGSVKGNRQAHRFRHSTTDISFGAYTSLLPHALVGVAANFEQNRLSFYQHDHNTLYNGQASLYATYTRPNYYLFADLIIARAHSDFHRSIHFGSINRKAHSTPKFWHAACYVESGLNLQKCDILMQPFLGVDMQYVNALACSEHRAKSLNLRIHQQNITSSNTYLGMHLGYLKKCIQVNGDIAWQYRLGSLGIRPHAEFMDFGKTYALRGINYGRNSLLGNLNIATPLYRNVDIYGEVSGEIWSRWTAYSGSIGISCIW